MNTYTLWNIYERQFRYTKAPFNSQFTQSLSQTPHWFLWELVNDEWKYQGCFETRKELAAHVHEFYSYKELA